MHGMLWNITECYGMFWNLITQQVRKDIECSATFYQGLYVSLCSLAWCRMFRDLLPCSMCFLSHHFILFSSQVYIDVAVAPMYSSFDLVYSPTGVSID